MVKSLLLAVIGFLGMIAVGYPMVQADNERLAIAKEVCLQLKKDVGLKDVSNCIREHRTAYKNGVDWSIPGKQDRYGRSL